MGALTTIFPVFLNVLGRYQLYLSVVSVALMTLSRLGVMIRV
jgi:hypothetical protein